MREFRERLGKEVLLLDGAMGSLLQGKGIDPEVCLEELNISRPELIEEIHKQYLMAGADILTTNTLGGTRIKLSEYGLGNKVFEVNFEGVRIAKKAASGNAYAALSVGPTGKFLEPLGELSFDETVDIFREQIKAGVEAGADIILLETMLDIREVKAALIAARDVTSLPLGCQLTFVDDTRMATGTDVETAVAIVESMDIDFVGTNCSKGPRELYPVFETLSRSTDLPLIIQPNAGLPELDGRRTVYSLEPAVLADYTTKFISLGASLVGGCCGTTPAHIRAIRQAMGNIRRPEPRPKHLKLASRTKLVVAGKNNPLLIVGERINPAGKTALSQELKEGRTTTLRKMAIEQTKGGASALDVNVSVAGISEAPLMELAVFAVNSVSDLPISIDSPDAAAIETGLKSVDGKPIVNSVSGKEESLNLILPLARKYGTALIALLVDDDGIPEDAKKRIAIAENILDRALKLGIRGENILFDPLALSLGASQHQINETLQALKSLTDKGLFSVLGISNVSYGLPERASINSTFLSMALLGGLTAAILNPCDEKMRSTALSAGFLLGEDKDGKRFIEMFRPKAEEKTAIAPVFGNAGKEAVWNAILEGDRENIARLVESALASGSSPRELATELVPSALDEVGTLFDRRQYFLPQVMLSAETAERAFRIIRPKLETGEAARKGKIVFATVRGDIHDIGKNIVISLLESHGFQVVDLGKGVPSERIVDEALNARADIIALSALMTTTMPRMEECIELARKKGLATKVMIGGAVVTEEYRKKIGADGYARDGMSAVKLAKSLMEKTAKKI
ncbi:MAG: homocysteine S-methyltransferase family protein [Candidatus Eisenbacteria bacterium]|nr:homocysteine S-methyltransferase family protein [Candidatus Eisenbacteria bacterium]